MGTGIRRKLLFSLIVFTVCAALLGIAGEILVRLRYPVQCMNLRLDEIPYVPSAMLRHVWEARKGQVRIRKTVVPINSLGYRGPEFSPEKAPGVFRIIIYGGSQVFDMNVGGLDDWPYRAGRLLRKAGFPTVEIINAGVLGNMSWEATAWLLGEGHRFDPDMVILCNQWNELNYLTSSTALVRSMGPFSRRDNPQLYSRNFLDRNLAARSCLYRALRYHFLTWKLGLVGEGARKSSGPPPELQETAFEQYALNVGEFIDLARRIGATPVLLIQPRLPIVDADPAARAKIHYDIHRLSHEKLCRAFKKMDEILTTISRTDKVLLLNSLSVMSGDPAYFEDHIHFNAAGSAKAAELLARELGESGLLRQE